MCAGTGTAANGAVSTTPSLATPEQSPPASVSSAKPDSRHGSKASDTSFTLKRFVETCTKQHKEGWLPIISKQRQVKGGAKSPLEGFQLLKPLQEILERHGALSLCLRHVCGSPCLLLLLLARMHVIKNAFLQAACSPRHLRVQTMAGREDENPRACANAGCVYLALRQMLLEQAKEGRSWSERKVKTLSNDLGLPGDFRDAISSLPDDHVILGVKGVSFSAGGADAGEENLQQSAAFRRTFNLACDIRGIYSVANVMRQP